MPTVVVTRHDLFAGRARAMKVTAGLVEGRVPAVGETRLEVPDGPLEVRASMDWCRSPVVRAELRGDDELHLATGLSANAFRVFYAPGRVVSLDVDPDTTRHRSRPDVLDTVTVTPGPRGTLTGALAIALMVVVALVTAWVVGRLLG